MAARRAQIERRSRRDRRSYRRHPSSGHLDEWARDWVTWRQPAGFGLARRIRSTAAPPWG
ncbi:hypothetical protein D8I24_4658 [Cupriavidus necator H850]|nr:hypothetical protein D8I24_4658 [Cupriavidus necator H850]